MTAWSSLMSIYDLLSFFPIPMKIISSHNTSIFPPCRYLDGVEFHSVMYKASDVKHPSPEGGCASQHLHNGRHKSDPFHTSSRHFRKDMRNSSYTDKSVITEKKSQKACTGVSRYIQMPPWMKILTADGKMLSILWEFWLVRPRMRESKVSFS